MQATAAMAFRKVVTVNVRGRDKYGRTVAEVVLPDGRTLNEELVTQGLAGQYRKYSHDPRLALMEAEAREAKRGAMGGSGSGAALGVAQGRTHGRSTKKRLWGTISVAGPWLPVDTYETLGSFA